MSTILNYLGFPSAASTSALAPSTGPSKTRIIQ
uniref:Cytochrome b6/f complex subunit VI n=1 Tax=Selaginella remotifolia TaxID=137170 RepID=A0A482CN97_SELRE|nr:cytochrome b6/f complex subunit VI [Selaginella remotifolia]QBL76281.1 cytochrome b6/f complex subunit VI [Selaginella remotifolia]